MRILCNCLFLIVLCARCYLFDESSEIDYYENLINTEIGKAQHYELPTNADSYRPKNNETEDFGTYDFIVVGAGAGGSVVANRLSEVKDWKVLLLEAGGPETNFSVIPGVNTYLQRSRFNWNFKTNRQSKACLGMINNTCSVPKGRALGGTTTINGMLYFRGNKNDFDRWAAQGNDGWSYEDVLPYFIKSENSQIDGDPGYHGRGGYWNVKYHEPNSDQMVAFKKGSNIVSYSASTDYNGKDELGVFYSQLNIIKRYRQSASKAFLEPIIDRPNLKILPYSYVTKVIIDPKTKTASGVTFTRNGTTYTVTVKKEVIVSAGTINSPQILMLSEIGPRQHLRQMKIPVIQDLPVGKSLRDHTLFFGSNINTNSSAPVTTLREQIKQFLNDYGPLTIALNTQGLGLYQCKFERTPKLPDFQIEVVPSIIPSANPSTSTGKFTQSNLGFNDDVNEALVKDVNFQTAISAVIFVLNAKSVGKISLRSKDPFTYPEIYINYLDNKHDIDVMYEGIKLLEEIVKTEPLRKINASLVYIDFPTCRDHEKGSNGYWVCVFHLLSTTGNHHTSTCKMGPDPKTSVVNKRGKIHGISGLRVVDASVIPFPLASHPCAATVMVGEKISDYIKVDHGLNYKINLMNNIDS